MKSKEQQLKKAERAWYRAKARAEQAADLVSDCERKVARLREDLNGAEVPGNTRLQTRRRKQVAKRLKGHSHRGQRWSCFLCPVQQQAGDDISPFRLGRAAR